MNGQHLRAILWLRFRLSANQLKRGGIASAVILALLAAFTVMAALTLFAVALVVGILTLPKASPDDLLIVWDVIVLAFLFIWLFGLVIELQRSEMLSFDKLLHLPVSLTGAFVFNYLSSLVSFSFVLFFPVMVGLSIALVVTNGAAMLVVFPLLAGFLLMVTALTYQFSGWLATLMTNQRRRRTVIAVATIGIIVVSQLPNIMQAVFSRMWQGDAAKQSAKQVDETDAGERQEQVKAPTTKSEDGRRAQKEKMIARARDIAVTVNVALPVGWLPYGTRAAAQGQVWPGVLGSLGTVLIGAASLWRSYRTTMRFYTGEFQTGKAPRQAAVDTRPAKLSNLVEKTLPWVSEPTAAIAAAGFRSLTRAPEVKLSMLTTVIMLVVFGALFLTRESIIATVRPFVAVGAIALSLLGILQLVQNQFGLDRHGFRAFVLAGVSRRDILLGKNLSLAPLGLGAGMLAIVLLELLSPMAPSHFVASLIQLVTIFLILCMTGNMASILAPMAVAGGSLRPLNANVLKVLLQFLFTMIFPSAVSITLVPLGLELLLQQFGWLRHLPVYLVLSGLEACAVLALYLFVLDWQGKLLQAREQKILEAVASKVE